MRVARSDAVTLNPGVSLVLEGLKISSGRYGVYAPKGVTLRMRNCTICGNDSHGLYIDNTDGNQIPVVIVYNSVFVSNGGSGVYMHLYLCGNYWCPPFLTLRNNILISNAAYGVQARYDSALGGPERVNLDYNDCVGNLTANYHPAFLCAGGVYSCGGHSISIAPEFVGGTGPVCNKDFRLDTGSPCKDAGDPGMGWLDPDGTRNDIGAYGGPGAQRFYTNPNDGPMVRDLELPQGMVPKGETFIIRATGAVR